jgi:hypothetical protein
MAASVQKPLEEAVRVNLDDTTARVEMSELQGGCEPASRHR